MTLPLRLMTLHFSHMGFTDGLTFIVITSYECLNGPIVVASFISLAFAAGESSLITPLLLSKRDPLRWARIWCPPFGRMTWLGSGGARSSRKPLTTWSFITYYAR